MLAIKNLQGQIKSSSFKFEILPDNIARYPTEDTEKSKMLVLDRASAEVEHKYFENIIDYFEEGDVLVVNDTKVFPACLYGKKEKNSANIEIILLRELSSEYYLWDVVVDPARKIRVGNKLFFGNEELIAEVEDNTTSRGRTIRFLRHSNLEEFYQLIYKWGQAPLPKDIRQKPEAIDKVRYQSMFAQKDRSVSVPDGSLLFTPHIIKRIQLKGVKVVPITLHTTLPSFQIVDVEDLNKYKIVSENYEVSQTSADTINKALDNKKRIMAMGTSVMRTLETTVSASNRVKAGRGWTDKFIYPPYDFKICSGIITNLHRPMSTPLMMISAFADYDLFVEAYHIAQQHKYKFLEYGDVMLVL